MAKTFPTSCPYSASVPLLREGVLNSRLSLRLGNWQSLKTLKWLASAWISSALGNLQARSRMTREGREEDRYF